MAPTSDGGLLILDRDNLCYWVLDRHFRLPAEIVEETSFFQPGGAVRQIISPHGCSLIASSPPEITSPLSIEAGPDGHVLILDAPERGSSVVYEFDGERIRHWYSLKEGFGMQRTMARPSRSRPGATYYVNAARGTPRTR
jgi:hypothetical protein